MRHLLRDHAVPRILLRPTLAGHWIFDVAQAVPDELADIELVVEQSCTALGVAVDRRGAPLTVGGTRHAIAVQRLGYFAWRYPGAVGFENTANNPSLSLIDPALAGLIRPLSVARGHDIVSVAIPAARATLFDELSREEIAFADDEFFSPLKVALAKTAQSEGWTLLRPQGVENRRGFCGARSWYHKYREAKQRQYIDPNSWTDSIGTLHPNTFGHYFATIRVLSQLRRDAFFDGHNISQMTAEDMHNPDQQSGVRRGFLWYVWNKDLEDVTTYYKFSH